MTPGNVRARIAAGGTAVTGTGAAASLALALLVLVCAFVAVAVPRASLGYRTAVLQRSFHAESSSSTTVLADATINGLSGGSLSAAQLASAQRQLSDGLGRDGLPLAPGTADWSGMVTGSAPFTVTGRAPDRSLAPPQLELLYRSALGRNARLVSGALPGAGASVSIGTSTGVGTGIRGTLQVAVTQVTAARFGLHPGSRLQAAGHAILVTGIIRPLRPASSFWTVDPVAAAPQLTYPTPDSAPYLSSGAFVSAAELTALQDYLSAPLRALWSFPLGLAGVTADQAAGLGRALAAVGYLPAATSVGTSLNVSAGPAATIQVSLSSGLATSLPSFVATDDAVQRALSLMFVSLAVIAAVVVLLGARLVAARRRAEFTMMRARGASLRQVSAVALGGGAAAVLPAAALGVGAAVAATPGPASPLAWSLAGLIVAAALAGPPVLAAWQQRTPRRAAAGPAPAARRRIAAARRWVTDAALVLGAAGGLILLRQQGLPPPGQVDLFTSAAPVLVAIPVALLVMRAYPVLLRQLARLAGPRRGVVLLVGFARGRAAAQAGVLPAFALVLAFAVIAFAGMARSAVAEADVAASWQVVGADAAVTAPAVGPGITIAAQRQITAVPGVRRWAAVAVAQGTSGQGLQLPVVIVDPGQYAALAATTPGPAFPAAALARGATPASPSSASPSPASIVPALISPAGRLILGPRSGLYVAGRQLRIRIAGTVPEVAGAAAGTQFAVLPRWAVGAQAPAPTVLVLTGPRLDQAALVRAAKRAVPGATVTLRSQVQAAIASAPLPHGGFVTFAQGAAAAAGFSLLVVLLTLVLGARSRELTLARLATMGLAADQSRRIVAVETLPAILAAAVGGTACALLLVPLAGPAVDLAAFTGVPVTVPLRADPVAIVAAAVALLLLGGLTLTISSRLARGRGAAQALRAGETAGG
jgi:putative ABC transport system permease protein